MKVYLYNNNKIWFYRVKKSDEVFNNKNENNETYFNLDAFLKKFNILKSEFEQLNGKISKISYGDVLIMPNSSKYCHIVQPTETLEKIAVKYGVNFEYLKSENATNKIFIGQKIFL